MRIVTRAVVAAACLFAASGAIANDGDDYAFVLVNKSSVDIVSFQANAGTGWSKNWLVGAIHAEKQRALKFSPTSTKDCAVKVRVLFSDDSKFEDAVDFCNVDFLKVSDKHMWTE